MHAKRTTPTCINTLYDCVTFDHYLCFPFSSLPSTTFWRLSLCKMGRLEKSTDLQQRSEPRVARDESKLVNVVLEILLPLFINDASCLKAIQDYEKTGNKIPLNDTWQSGPFFQTLARDNPEKFGEHSPCSKNERFSWMRKGCPFTSLYQFITGVILQGKKAKNVKVPCPNESEICRKFGFSTHLAIYSHQVSALAFSCLGSCFRLDLLWLKFHPNAIVAAHSCDECECNRSGHILYRPTSSNSLDQSIFLAIRNPDSEFQLCTLIEGLENATGVPVGFPIRLNRQRDLRRLFMPNPGPPESIVPHHLHPESRAAKFIVQMQKNGWAALETLDSRDKSLGIDAIIASSGIVRPDSLETDANDLDSKPPPAAAT